LTKTFILAKSFPTFLRETITQSATQYISLAVNILQKITITPLEGEYHAAILDSLIRLLPSFPTLFRTHEANILAQIQPLLLTPSSKLPTYQRSLKTLSQKLYIFLHYCASKGQAPKVWESRLEQVINRLRQAIDRALSIVDEGDGTRRSTSKSSSNGVSPSPFALSLDTLPGDAIDIIIDLLQFIGKFMSNQTSASVTIPVSELMDLCNKLFMTTSQTILGRNTAAIGGQSSYSTEKQRLVTSLPCLHSEAIKLANELISAGGIGYYPQIHTYLRALIWVFDADCQDETLRDTVYSAISLVLQVAGPSLSRKQVELLLPIINNCCDDLLENLGNSRLDNQALKSRPKTLTIDMKEGGTLGVGGTLVPTPKTSTEACALLPLILCSVRSETLSAASRARLDQTAVLTQNKNALLSSVLYPPALGGASSRSSIIPHLARLFSGSIEAEGLVRPRLPVYLYQLIEEELNNNADDDESGDNDRNETHKSAAFEHGVSIDMSHIEVESHPLATSNLTEESKHGAVGSNPSLFPSHQSSGSASEQILLETAEAAEAAETANTRGHSISHSKDNTTYPPLVEGERKRSPSPGLGHTGSPKRIRTETSDLSVSLVSANPITERETGVLKDDEDDDDREFSIPQLVMESDTDEDMDD
jgi:pre-rRNA-processing protein RIX1